MPRYVLLQFDDTVKAAAFVRRVNGEYAAVDDDRPIKVRAVWAIPTKFCECQRSRGKMWPFSRGVKSGWWLHVDCGRPTRAWGLGVHWFDSIGRNLLPGNHDEVPQGWGLPNHTRDPGTNDVGHIIPQRDQPTERRQRKAENRRNRKRTINPRRGA